MESKYTEENSGAIVGDPAADLKVLKQAQAAVELDQVMDFGPWWYTPLMASFVAATSLFVTNTSDTTFRVLWIVGFALGAFVAWHDHRRRSYRGKPSAKGFLLRLPMALLAFVVLSLWMTAIATIGIDDFVPGPVLIGWGLTTLALLGVRASVHRLASRRSVREPR